MTDANLLSSFVVVVNCRLWLIMMMTMAMLRTKLHPKERIYRSRRHTIGNLGILFRQTTLKLETDTLSKSS